MTAFAQIGNAGPCPDAGRGGGFAQKLCRGGTGVGKEADQSARWGHTKDFSGGKVGNAVRVTVAGVHPNARNDDGPWGISAGLNGKTVSGLSTDIARHIGCLKQDHLDPIGKRHPNGNGEFPRPIGQTRSDNDAPV